jgi:hypothetical protein
MGRKEYVMTPKEKREQEILSEGTTTSIDENDNIVTQPIGLEKVNTSTRLLDKNFSPLIVRKYMSAGHGWPLYISLICDVSLSNLDDVVNQFKEDYGDLVDDIQWVRNFCGGLSDHLVSTYEAVKPGCVEGVAVLWYVDKMFVSSLYGDFMVHASCKQELYAIINTLPHI